MRTLSLCLALSALAACAGDGAPELNRVESCDALQDQLEHMALREARFALSMNFDVQARSWGMVEYDLAAEDSGNGAQSYSTTNVQELGIDEADRVETDGTYLFSLAGRNVMISRAFPTDEAELLATIAIDGTPTGIYLYGDKLVVTSVLPWEQGAPRSGETLPWGSKSLVTVVDVTDRADPLVTREAYVAGDIWSSRRIDGRLLVVSYYDVAVDTNGAETLGEAQRAIRDADVEAWLPWRHDGRLVSERWQSESGRALQCDDIWLAKRETGTFFTVAMSLDLDDPEAAFTGQAVVGRADSLYASKDALYVSYSETPDGLFRSLDNRLDTVVHKFDIASAEQPSYVDTAVLEGVAPDQFAFSEHHGVLRVATSDPDTLTTNVYALQENDAGELVELDRIRDLAPGETLYSARFVGDIGYLVTYVARGSDGPEIVQPDFTVDFDPFWIPYGDPLFTLDLSDPRDLKVVGELVLNGWSDYIHPLGDDHLLTVGMDGEPGTSDWHVAVSLFDVTDLAHPVLEDRELLAAASSEAQQDHHAFNYFADLEMLAMPSQSTSGEAVLELLHANTDGIEPVGRVRQTTVNASISDPWCAPIRRSVFLDDTVWAVSDGGLTAASIEAPGVELAAIPFTEIDPCNWYYGW